MIPLGSRLVLLVRLVDRLPMPASQRRRRGRPHCYSDRLFLKALVVMIVRRLHRPGELLAVLDEPTPEMLEIRALLSEHGCVPCRRTWERRLGRIPETLPAQIRCLGHCLVEHSQPGPTAAVRWRSTRRCSTHVAASGTSNTVRLA
jgi:hypothetical protein